MLCVYTDLGAFALCQGFSGKSWGISGGVFWASRLDMVQQVAGGSGKPVSEMPCLRACHMSLRACLPSVMILIPVTFTSTTCLHPGICQYWPGLCSTTSRKWLEDMGLLVPWELTRLWFSTCRRSHWTWRIP